MHLLRCCFQEVLGAYFSRSSWGMHLAVTTLGQSTRVLGLLLVLKGCTSFLGFISRLQVLRLSGDPRALSVVVFHVVGVLASSITENHASVLSSQ